ncbi:hypothetical protein P3W45_000286 [Vairimorpha bombi]|jgi:hypothetical protein
MENNLDEDERKFFTNGLVLNKLGDTRDFGNFYELIHNRKLKVLSFLNKDLSQIANPDFRQFETIEHAYDIFLSFHIFYPYLYEDYMFMKTNESLDLSKDLEDCIEELNNIKDVVNINKKEEHGLACELLIFHELRKLRCTDEYEEESVEKSVIKRKSGLNKRNTVVRLKTSKDLIDTSKGIRISNYKLIFKRSSEH